ncbi:LuxR family transcriptional regulator [Streptomyces spongiicola]|uniref:LuxR family transcriptional regulator n=1 Tax=Streptomyces spongiicola TaxID=1690221 RepID=A0ABM6VEW7_9ACTN|nr:LuxR family transcriptional regulator [Streptomyces spongiicola]
MERSKIDSAPVHPRHPISPAEVRGREKQLARTGAQLRRVARGGRSAVLLVEAAPGAGKTRFLAEAAKLADADGFAVVDGTPAGSDAAIEAARTRLRHADGIRTAVVLDDLHLASRPALTALRDLVVALRGLPILWMIAFSTDRGDPLHEPLKDCLGSLRAGLPVEDVGELGPIEGEALVRLVADCTGAAPDPALLALAESVNDTPRAVIDLMRGLAEDDLCVVDGTSRLQLGPPGAALLGGGSPAPVPKRFSVLIQQDLRSLSEPTLKALRLAAVLGSPFAPEDLSALLGEAPAGLLTAVDEAVDRGLLVCGEHDLAFRTEPIWRVLLDSVPPPVCALLRRQAAKMLLPRPDGVERAALQLVHVAQPGNAEEIRVISDGARKLLAADPSTAASLATRCMELLAPGQAERLRLARTAVEAFTKAGHLERAIALARAAIDDAAPLAPPLPAEFAEDVAALKAAMSTALLLLGNVQSARRAAGDALAARRAGSQHREAVIAHLAASYLTGDGTAMDRAQQILDAPDRHTRAVVVGAMTFRAFGQWRDGEVGQAVSTLREAVALDLTSEEEQMLDPRWFLAFALTRTDEYEQAAAVVRGSADTSAPVTGALTTAVPAVLRAQLHLAQGRLDEAEAEARAGVGTDGRRIPMLAPQAWLVLASVALRRGALTQAEEHVGALKKHFPQHVSSPWWAARLLMNARLAEAQAGPLAAAEVLAELGAQAGALREAVMEDPAAAAWCVRSMLAADRPDLVEMVIGTTQDVLVRNPRLPSVLATALHARALAEGDPEALARAGRLHRNPWAQAAAAEDHAALLLDRGDHGNAISELDRAMSAYGALGGERDAARVRARLRGLGVRRRHWQHAKRPLSGWESLTRTERKVAELVAGGLTNQQAARHLFISPHTVGFHLRQIYRKLGIRSRTALIRLRA